MLTDRQKRPGILADGPAGNQARIEEGGPITLINAEPSGVTVLDEPPPGTVSEIDTLAAGSGDSDTI